jgi:hypothetical protein
MTVVPRLYSALARPSSSSSRSPCTPDGAGDWEDRGESSPCPGWRSAMLAGFCIIIMTSEVAYSLLTLVLASFVRVFRSTYANRRKIERIIDYCWTALLLVQIHGLAC